MVQHHLLLSSSSSSSASASSSGLHMFCHSSSITHPFTQSSSFRHSQPTLLLTHPLNLPTTHIMHTLLLAPLLNTTSEHPPSLHFTHSLFTCTTAPNNNTPQGTTSTTSSRMGYLNNFNLNLNLNPVSWFSRRSNAERAVAKYAGAGGIAK